MNPRVAALRSLRGLYASMRQRSGQVRRATGLGSAFVWALAEIAARPGTRIGDLAERLRVHPSTASNLCARLRRQGLVTSRVAENDRRAMRLYVAAKGKVLLRKVPAPTRGNLAEALDRMSDKECRDLSRALEPLAREVGRSLPGRNADGE